MVDLQQIGLIDNLCAGPGFNGNPSSAREAMSLVAPAIIPNGSGQPGLAALERWAGPVYCLDGNPQPLRIENVLVEFEAQHAQITVDLVNIKRGLT